MPFVQRALNFHSSLSASGAQYARAVSSSTAAPSNGKPTKTPIIAGSVCGGVLLIAWLIGFVVYFRKRYNRKKRKRAAIAAGLPPPEVKSRPPDGKVLIPPDPAVLLGQRGPGYAFSDGTAEKDEDKGKEKAGVGKKSQESVERFDNGGVEDRSGSGSTSRDGKQEVVRPSLSLMANMPELSTPGQLQSTNKTEPGSL